MTEKTLRDEFAMAALQGILTNAFGKLSQYEITAKHEMDMIVKGSYVFADAMLAARKERVE